MRTTWGLLAAGARCSGFCLQQNPRSSTGLSVRYAGSLTMSSPQSVGVPEKKFAYAYCHGFLSGPGSVKGQALRESLLEKGVDLSLLNLNGEDDDPGAITCSGAVGAVRAFHLGHKSASGNPGLKLRLAGSSLGGYIAARYAELYPEDVDRIFMLCPSFGLGARAQNFGSEAEMADWERTGARVFPLSTGGEASIPWAFVQEARLQTDYPAYRCPAAIVHGLRDDVVPASVTRLLVEGSGGLAERTFATFVEDDHALTRPSTLALTIKALADFFDVGGEGAEEGTERAAVGRESVAKGIDRRLPQRNIEVEAKFSAHDVGAVKEAVLTRGGQLAGEQVFADIYWDARGCGLTERDWWLRTRAGRWELKESIKKTNVPAADVGEGVTAYREVTLASEVARELIKGGFLGAADANVLQGSCLDERVLEGAGFQTFASFRTNREKFRLEGFVVDIDRASFGHEVVEIETISGPEEVDIVSARDSINALARSLGAQRNGESGRPIKGKLMEYIIRSCPRQLEVLTRQRARQGRVDEGEQSLEGI